MEQYELPINYSKPIASKKVDQIRKVGIGAINGI